MAADSGAARAHGFREFPKKRFEPLLEELATRELLSPRSNSSFPDEVEYVFRHSLLREGAYASLTDEDRVLGHRLAGEWLEQKGERDAFTLGQHYLLGQSPERAATFFRAAAEHALAGNDLQAAVERAELALTCAPSEAVRAECNRVTAQALHWLGRHDEAARAAREAMSHLSPGSAAWFWALGDRVSAATRTDRSQEYLECEVLALGTDPAISDDPSAAMRCLARCAGGTLKHGRHEALVVLSRRVDELTQSRSPLPPLAVGYAQHFHAAVAYYSGDAAAHYRANELAVAAFDEAGDLRSACNARLNLGCACAEFGELSRAEELLRDVRQVGERLGLPAIAAFALNNLGPVLAGLGRLSEALEIETMALDRARMHGEKMLEGAALTELAHIALGTGDAERAERDARASVALFEQTPMHRSAAHAVLSRALTRQGRFEEALAEARQGRELVDRFGAPHDAEMHVWLALAQAQYSLGNRLAAAEALDGARDRVQARAEFISDPEKRRSFIEGVPSHVSLRAMREEWAL